MFSCDKSFSLGLLVQWCHRWTKVIFASQIHDQVEWSCLNLIELALQVFDYAILN